MPQVLISEERGTGRFDDSIEPKTCGQCPFWQASDRSPGVGYCTQFDEKTIDWEIPAGLCITLFWQFVQTPQPANELAIAVDAPF